MVRLAPNAFKVDEIKALWRALIKLPRADISDSRDLLGFARRDAAPPNPDGDAEDLERFGIYDRDARTIVLYNASFGWEISHYSLDEIVARLVGRSAWMRYRVATGIADPDAFAAYYARFYLSPDLFRLSDPKRYEFLARHLEPTPPKSGLTLASLSGEAEIDTGISTEERNGPDEPVVLSGGPIAVVDLAAAHRAVLAWLGDRYDEEIAEEFSLTTVPSFEDFSLTAPFYFIRALRPAAPGSGDVPQDHCLGIDGRADGTSEERGDLALRVYFATKDGFQAFVDTVSRKRAVDELGPALLVRAWFALSYGFPPKLVVQPPPERSGQGGPMVTVPAIARAADGAHLITAWTHGGRNRKFQRHSIKIERDGSATAWTEEEDMVTR